MAAFALERGPTRLAVDELVQELVEGLDVLVELLLAAVVPGELLDPLALQLGFLDDVPGPGLVGGEREATRVSECEKRW